MQRDTESTTTAARQHRGGDHVTGSTGPCSAGQDRSRMDWMTSMPSSADQTLPRPPNEAGTADDGGGDGEHQQVAGTGLEEGGG